MNKLISKLCKYLLLNDIIKEEDISLYEYGFYQIFFYIIEYGCLFIIAIILDAFGVFLVFLFSIMIIRKNAGGIHSESHLICFVLTCLIFFIVLRTLKTSEPISILKYICIPLIISVILIIILAPVETPNKELSSNEYRVYRKRTLIALLLDMSIFTLSVIVNRLIIAEAISFSIIISATLVVSGKIKMLCLKGR